MDRFPTDTTRVNLEKRGSVRARLLIPLLAPFLFPSLLARALPSLAPLGGGGSGGGVGVGLGGGSSSFLSKPKLGSLGATPSTLNKTPLASTLPAGATASSSSTSSSYSASSSRIEPIKFAIRFNPLTLALEYRDRKHPHRPHNRIKVFKLTQIFTPSELQVNVASSSPSSRYALDRLAQSLADKYPQYLNSNLVTQAQLVRLLKKALTRNNVGGGGGSAASSVHSSANQSLNSSLDEDEMEMSTGSTGSYTGANSSNNMYGNRSASAQPSSSSSLSSSSLLSLKSAPPLGKLAALPTSTSAARPTFHMPGGDDEDEEDDQADLNRVSEEELVRRKEEMNKGQLSI